MLTPGKPAKSEIIHTSLNGLVVDDDPIVAEHAALLLRRFGILDTLVVTSVANARRVLAIRPPDLVVCDIHMPEEDGFGLLDTLSESSPSAGILVHSAHHERIMLAATEAARSMGFPWVGHIAKPLSDQPFFALLEDFSRSACIRIEASPDKLDAEALRAGAFTVWFQPQAYARDASQLFGIEALVRWRGSDNIIHPPAAFLDTVERHGMEMEMLGAILPPALDVLQRLRARWPALKLSLNISPTLLADNTLLKVITRACAARQLLPGVLTLELTETPTSDHAKWRAMLANAARFRLAGVGLAIDDFGTRESSVERATLLPISEVKIDKLFVHTARQFSHARSVLRALRAIAVEVGAVAVVEGVETSEDLAMASDMGFDVVQGFHISWPLAADELLARYG